MPNILEHYPKHPLVICGSSRFCEEMQIYGRWAAKIMRIPMFDVTMPEERATNIAHKTELMKRHTVAIAQWNPVVIIYNGEEDYIGINTAIETGQAYYNGKTVFLSHPTKIPELLALGIKTVEERP